MKHAENLKIGDTVAVTVKRLGINGEGIGYYRRKALFIPGALPGEVVKAKIKEIHPRYLLGELKEIEKPSAARKKPDCPVFDICGGCQLQHMDYQGQLEAKKEIVREAFAKYTALSDPPIRPVEGMDRPWHYRNKAQVQTGWMNGELAVGLYAPGTHRLVDTSGCPIQHPGINRAVETAKEILRELHIPPYNERKKTGAIRTIVARISRSSGKIQLTFVTATPELPRKNELIAKIRERMPEIETIAQNINPKKTSLIFGEKTVILWGRETIEEKLGNLSFSLSPRSFFQLNPAQTEKLYQYVLEAAALTGSERVVDAYCGTGTIALWLAPHAREVWGIESVKEAVEDARRNAKTNGIENVRFVCGKAEQILNDWHKQGFRAEVIVVDPPRSGCDESLLEAVIQMKPKRFVYVSCNPSTLAKNCQTLLEGGFSVEWIQPADMFPHTAHVECVVLMSR